MVDRWPGLPTEEMQLAAMLATAKAATWMAYRIHDTNQPLGMAEVIGHLLDHAPLGRAAVVVENSALASQ